MKKGKVLLLISALFLAMASPEIVLAADETALQPVEESNQESEGEGIEIKSETVNLG